MSDTPKFKAPRPFNEIQADYVNLATKAGDIGYKIASFQKDLELVHSQMRDLNFESIASNEAAQKAKAEADAKAKAEAAAATPSPTPDNVTPITGENKS